MNKEKHLLLKALDREEVSRPPVWMMRQAGRYLPEYMVLRRKYDFFTRVETPELAAEITLQPIDILKPDAAILFSDILVIPKAMGMDVQLVEKKGPVLPQPIRDIAAIDQLNLNEAADRLQHVYDAVKLTKSELNGRVPLIGFAGAPWTILCYMIEGQGSKTFSKAKSFCFTHPEWAKLLLQKITDVSIEYLQRKVAAGAEVIQVFDSWSGILSHDDFERFAKPYLVQISDALSEVVPVILFPKGSWYAYSELGQLSCSAIGIDWTVRPKLARQLIGPEKTLQGNFDPSKLLMPREEIVKATKQMIQNFGIQGYIANLGHGITPEVPVDHARAFIDTVKQFGQA